MTDRTVNAISTAELQRRWQLTRDYMARQGIDAIVTQSHNDWLGGYVKWLTDIPADHAYPKSVIFSRDEGMVLIEQGPFNKETVLQPGDAQSSRGLGRIATTPSYVSVNYTGQYDAEIVLKELRRAGHKTIGLLGTAAMYHDFCAYLKTELKQSHLVDCTDAIDALKSIKSAEEISFIGRTARMQDAVIEALKGHIQPGMRDFEIAAFAQYQGQLLGSEQGIFLASSSPVGSAAMFRPRHLQNRVLEKGDVFTILVENNGPGGFYTEIARTFVLGRAPDELKQGIDLVLAAQRDTLLRLVPGTPASEVFAGHNAWRIANGMNAERRLHSHGQGYDMVERPLIRQDETMTIEENMNIVVHPSIANDKIFAVMCDNFMIGPNGPLPSMHRTPQQIIEL